MNDYYKDYQEIKIKTLINQRFSGQAKHDNGEVCNAEVQVTPSLMENYGKNKSFTEAAYVTPIKSQKIMAENKNYENSLELPALKAEKTNNANKIKQEYRKALLEQINERSKILREKEFQDAEGTGLHDYFERDIYRRKLKHDESGYILDNKRNERKNTLKVCVLIF